ncbi:MAG: DNA/RNA nuclease SfsA [Pseudomonadales bacterium]|jgi:sugar fermentation stimulation protein A|nr:DNA/RNA nuclease SfsA [Pseudomonadales bacterium]MDP6970035.1 DNA/RNA nuclease SfsA [Pseudomonadales bacterium]|tara:strand:+ start:45 stop:758 length:714 start_codon:yes stop_codon:yes gene_type:complete
MIFDPPFIPATLLCRYKRFLADVRFRDGVIVTAHCPNTGTMLGCTEPGSDAWVSVSDNAKRKYPHTLEIVRARTGLVGVNTARANRIIEQALKAGAIRQLTDYPELRREVAVPDEKGRFDFLLDGRGDGRCYVEVKSMTLALEDGRGAFPDAVSERASRHVRALARQVEAGHRGVLLFCVQHTGISYATLADEIDAAYGESVRGAVAAGVEVLAYGCDVAPTGIALCEELEVRLAKR